MFCPPGLALVKICLGCLQRCAFNPYQICAVGVRIFFRPYACPNGREGQAGDLHSDYFFAATKLSSLRYFTEVCPASWFLLSWFHQNAKLSSLRDFFRLKCIALPDWGREKSDLVACSDVPACTGQICTGAHIEESQTS